MVLTFTEHSIITLFAYHYHNILICCIALLEKGFPDASRIRNSNSGTMKQFFIVVTLLLVYVDTVLADFGLCRFDEDKCSCKIGDANQGSCWDKIVGQPGRCTKRFCNAGWTCACSGRTHVCNKGLKPVNIVSDDDASKSTADCQTASRAMVASQDISLGTFKIHLSRSGVLANDCAQIAWWHNGILLGNRGTDSGMSEATVDIELAARRDHSLLELRPGDVLAFRTKEASYYCYKHFSEMVVNGTSLTTNMASVETYYAREYTTDWFLPTYKLTAENIAADETETNLKKFLPLRKTKLASNEAIIAGNDYWEPRDDANMDNKRSNWYYRIQIAETLNTAGNEL